LLPVLERLLLLLFVVLLFVLLLVLRLVVLLPLLLLLVVVVVPNRMSHEGSTVTTPRSNIAAKIHFFMINIVYIGLTIRLFESFLPYLDGVLNV